MTGAEIILWSRLRRHLYAKFRRQHPVGPYIVDFACIAAKLVVEVDGETHGSDAERAHDDVREKYLAARGWQVLRVWNSDVYRNLHNVLDAVDRCLPPPPLRGPPPP